MSLQDFSAHLLAALKGYYQVFVVLIWWKSDTPKWGIDTGEKGSHNTPIVGVRVLIVEGASGLSPTGAVPTPL
jgi:hypothetical protein